MPDQSVGGVSVSRETYDKLRIFEGMVRTWTKKINVVAARDHDGLWTRHIEDSAQLLKLQTDVGRWVDLGSGGGFPGVVVAIMLEGDMAPGKVTLIESDKRKCAFLSMAVRELGINAEIVPRRVDDIPAQSATTLSARALAPLGQLLCWAERHLDRAGTAIFPKGRSWEKELASVEGKWSFDCDVIRSFTDAEAALLKLRNIQRI